MEFLVNIAIALPEGLSGSDRSRLIEAEVLRGRELAAAGHLVRLWRTPTTWGNWGIWRAVDEAALDECLSSLPLYPHMSITVHALAPHPNDPGS